MRPKCAPIPLAMRRICTKLGRFPSMDRCSIRSKLSGPGSIVYSAPGGPPR
jgi:hypothetical protein